MAYGNTSVNLDYWDPNILATSNWLDLVGDIDDFSQLQFPFSYDNECAVEASATGPAWNAPNPQHTSSGHACRPASTLTMSPSAITPRSGESARTAADLMAIPQETTGKRGDFYVDGEPARRPRIMSNGRFMRRISPEMSGTRRSNFSLQIPPIDESSLEHRLDIPLAIYDQLVAQWQSLCIANTAFWTAFEAAEFPPRFVFEHSLALYFSHFHPTLPLLHVGTFSPAEADSNLILAMSSVGARYLDTDAADVFVISLQEFLRRCLIHERETGDGVSIDTPLTVQTYVLHMIGLIYSGDETLVRFGLHEHRPLVVGAACSLIDAPPTDFPGDSDGAWRAWLHRELCSRAWYSAFLLDCMVTYQFQERSLLSLSQCDMPLPCPDAIWADTTLHGWNAGTKPPIPAPTLPTALHQIYIDKWVPQDRGEFARIIMMHGLFSRTAEVESYYSNPLSHWEPTAEKQDSVEILPTHPIWPPSVPKYTKWQNSVCDCLDILHWQANATIGQARGLEHPTVAFLHLSRVILLTPVTQIVGLARAIARADSLLAGSAQDRRFIQFWVSQGQYKARLAAIHAGVVFWHVRRYSVHGFYEASTVALAALILWAFGSFSNSRKEDSEPSNTTSSQNDGLIQTEGAHDDKIRGDTCNIILLDRPTDDELVQQFIRRGHGMNAYLDGVGNLYDRDGPERVLAEGCKLLRTLRCWGAAGEWLKLLHSVGKAYGHK